MIELVAAALLAPAMSLSVAPERVTLAPSGVHAVLVRNGGARPVVADVAVASYALDLRGRPQVGVPARRWIGVSPARVSIRPGGEVTLRVAALPARGAAAGDHASALLLTSRPAEQGSVPVRMRVGIVVVVRVPGRLRRRLVLGALRIVGRGRSRRLTVAVANRGDLDEWQSRRAVSVVLQEHGGPPLRLFPLPRRFLAHTRGVLEFRGLARLAGVVRGYLEVARPSPWLGPTRRRLVLRL